MIPGSNLLDVALSVINPQPIQYYKATGRSLNINGVYETTYASPVNIFGSFQPVPRNLYPNYGLDFSKVYFNLYTSNDLIDVQRGIPPDKFVFVNNGVTQTFIVESSNDWFGIDNWLGILCILQTGQAE